MATELEQVVHCCMLARLSFIIVGICNDSNDKVTNVRDEGGGDESGRGDCLQERWERDETAGGWVGVWVEVGMEAACFFLFSKSNWGWGLRVWQECPVGWVGLVYFEPASGLS